MNKATKLVSEHVNSDQYIASLLPESDGRVGIMAGMMRQMVQNNANRLPQPESALLMWACEQVDWYEVARGYIKDNWSRKAALRGKPSAEFYKRWP